MEAIYFIKLKLKFWISKYRQIIKFYAVGFFGSNNT